MSARNGGPKLYAVPVAEGGLSPDGDSAEGTIFDPNGSDSIRRQRICGLYVMNGVNPIQVVKGSASVRRRGDEAEVSFLVTLPARSGGAFARAEDAYRLGGWDSVTCEHGGEPHLAVQRHSFVTTWAEVAL